MKLPLVTGPELGTLTVMETVPLPGEGTVHTIWVGVNEEKEAPVLPNLTPDGGVLLPSVNPVPMMADTR